MKPLRTACSVLSIVACGGASAANQLITFDDLVKPTTPFSGAFPVPGYHGYTWSGGRGDANSWAVSQPVAGNFAGTQTHSGNNFAWANGATSLQLTATAGGMFDVVSFWGRNGSGTNAIFAHGFRSGVETFTQTVGVGSTYALMTLNFNAIDRFLIDPQTSVAGIPNLLVDDLTISVVPEPATLTLWALGLAGVGLAPRRRAPRA